MEKNALSIFLIHLEELQCLTYVEDREPEMKIRFDIGRVFNICNTGTLLLCVVNVHISDLVSPRRWDLQQYCVGQQKCIPVHIYIGHCVG